MKEDIFKDMSNKGFNYKILVIVFNIPPQSIEHFGL